MVDQELVDNETIYSSTMSSLSTEDYDTSTTFDELTTSPFPNPDPTTVYNVFKWVFTIET